MYKNSKKRIEMLFVECIYFQYFQYLSEFRYKNTSQSRWETNLSIVGLIKSELNSVFKRFLAILTSVINYCKISQNIVLFWVQIG